MSRSHGEAWRLWRAVDQHGAELDMCQAANCHRRSSTMAMKLGATSKRVTSNA
jgi:hypothetical protein